MSGIWGSASNDVYAVGEEQNNNLSGAWHYDGTQWSEITLSNPNGSSNSDPITLADVYGFGASDIWIVGYASNPPFNSYAFHYDGKYWTKESLNMTIAQCIGGRSSTDLDVGGMGGKILHFDGAYWSEDSVSYHIPVESFMFFSFFSIVKTSSSNLYANALLHNNSTGVDTRYLFTNNSKVWQLVDSSVAPESYMLKIWLSPSQQLYGSGLGIFRWTGSGWTAIHNNDPVYSYLNIFGTADDNIFVTGDGGKFENYNGVDWYQYPNMNNPSNSYMGGWTDGKEVFVISIATGVSTIYHGRQ